LVGQRWYKERWALLVTSLAWRKCCVKYKKVRRYQRGNKTSVIPWPKGKGKNIYKIPHTKQKIEHQKSHLKQELNPWTPDEWAALAPHVIPIATNPVLRKRQVWLQQTEHIRGHLSKEKLCKVEQGRDGNHKTFEVMILFFMVVLRGPMSLTII
jgi:hypothetical protein